MDVFTMLKFWKSNKAAKVAARTTAIDTDTVTDSVSSDPLTEDSDDDDDSFFELELTLPKYHSQIEPCSNNSEQERETDDRKPSSKPQSPISVIRSASPKLRDFMFGKLRRKTQHREDFETESDYSSNLSPRNSNSNLFTVKFKIEDGSIVPKFSRSNSSSLFSPNRSSDDSSETSKRFSKDVVQKYLGLMKKPSFGKSLKKNGETTEKFSSSSSPARSTASFPSPRKEREEKMSSRFKVKCNKQLGKSKSSPAMIVSPSPLSFPARNDHPLDGIEGAILHCKRSLNSTGLSLLSRCSSDPSHEKSIQVSEEI